MPASTTPGTSAGTIISLSAGTPAAMTDTAYAALTYTAIGEVTDGGTAGRTYNVATHQPLATRGVVKLKGSFDDGTMTLEIGWAPGDPGQVLVQTALDDDAFYAVKIAYKNGTIRYFQALVTSAPVALGGTDTVMSTSVALAIKSGSMVTKHPT